MLAVVVVLALVATAASSQATSGIASAPLAQLADEHPGRSVEAIIQFENGVSPSSAHQLVRANRGRVTGELVAPVKCVPYPDRSLVVQVETLIRVTPKAIEKAPKSYLGKLEPARHENLTGWNTNGLPRWQVTVGGQTYHLEFDGDATLALLDRAVVPLAELHDLVSAAHEL